MSNEVGLQRIIFYESATFKHADLDIASNTLLLGDSGVGKTSIMRATLFFYTMDYSKSILGINDNESKVPFIEWYFDILGSSHIAYMYQTANGKFLFIVSRHKKIKYTFVNITNYEGDVNRILLNDNNLSISSEDLDVKLSVLGLEHYSTTKRDEYKKIFVKNEYPRLGSAFIQKNLEHVKYYLFKDMSDISMYGKYLSKIFLNNKVSEASIKEILTSLVSLDVNNEKYDLANRLDVLDIDTRLEKLQQYENDHNRFVSRLSTVEATRSVIQEYQNKLQELNEKKKKLAFALDNQYKIIGYFNEKSASADKEHEQLKSDRQSSDEKYSQELIGIGSLINSHENSIKEYKADLQKYKEMNIDRLIELNDKEDEYKKLFDKATNQLELLETERSELKNKTKQQELFTKEDITLRYDKLAKEFNELIASIDESLDALIEKKDKDIETIIEPRKESLKELQKEHNKQLIKATQLEGKIGKSKTAKIENEEIISLNGEITSLEKEQKTHQDQHKMTSAQITSVEGELTELSNEYSDKKEKIEIKYNVEKEKIETKITSLEGMKDNLLDYNSQTLFGKVSRDESEHRDKIISLVDDEILYNEDILVVKKDDTDTLYGYEVNFNFESYENKIEILKEDIKSQRATLSTLKELHKKNLTSLDRETKRNKEKKERLYKELRKKQTDTNSSIINTKNKISNYVTLLDEAIEKEKYSRDFEIEQMEESLDTFQAKNRLQKGDVDELEKKINEESKRINVTFKEEKEKLSRQKKNTKQKLDDLNSKKNEEIKDAVTTIWNNYKTLLEDNDVDISELDKLNKTISHNQEILETIKNNRMHIYTYNSKKESFEKIPSLESDLIKHKEKEKGLGNTKKKTLENLDKLIASASEKLQKYKSYNGKLEKLYEELEENSDSLQLWEVSLSDYYFPENELQVIESNIDIFCSGITAYKESRFTLKDIEEQLHNKVVAITKGFSRNNTLGLPIIDDTITSTFEYIQIAKRYISDMDNEIHKQGRELSLGYISETISYIKVSVDNIRLKLHSIDQLVKDVNKIIESSIENIGVLDFLVIKFDEDKTNPIIERIDELIEYTDAHSHIYIGGLVQEKDRDIYENIHKKIAKLKTEVEAYKKSEITISDLVSISFKISENGKDLGTVYTLNDVGSNGTGIMVRSIIYISLLYKNSMKCRIDEGQTFHCIIDEIGQISENYFEQLMNFAKEKGFSFLNGIPVKAEDMIALYPTIYTGYRENGKSVMLNTTKEVINIA